MLPRRELQGWQAGTRLSMSDVPPACISMRWSAVVAGWPHQWQAGLDASRALRLLRYFGVSYSRVMSGVPLWRGRPLLARAPQGACCHASCRVCTLSPLALSVCLRGGQRFVNCGQSPFGFVSFIRRAAAFWACRSTLVPECYQSPANRARSVRVFSCR